MSLEDWAVMDEEGGACGQGTVAKVRHRVDGRMGALKRLHETGQTERRYRFLAEVSGLGAMPMEFQLCLKLTSQSGKTFTANCT